MLNHAEVQRLRRSAIQSQFRRRAPGRRVTARFCGGPLGRIQTTVPSEAAEGLYVGFCVVTDRGPVQALYRRGAGTAWRFRDLVSGAL